MKKVLFIIICLSFMSAEYYAKVDDSTWKASSSKIECSLKHTIPNFGDIVFRQSSGYELEADLNILTQNFIPGEYAYLDLVAPSWQKPYLNQEKLKVTLPANGKTILLSDLYATNVLNGLLLGAYPRLSYLDPSKKSYIRAKISPVGFAKSHEQFEQCQNTLVTKKFEELRESNIYFDNNTALLTKKARVQMQQIAEYAKQEEIYRIDLYGYSDSQGTYDDNYKLSVLRVLAVKRYLTKLNVSEKRMVVKAFGEDYPLANNATKQGRNLNRRVLIRLHR